MLRSVTKLIAAGQGDPHGSSSASRADVPLPHGERSTSPSANTVTLRWVSGLFTLVLPEDHAVDVAKLRLERVDDDVLPVFDLALELAAELDQARELAPPRPAPSTEA